MNKKQFLFNSLNKKDQIASVLLVLWGAIVILFVIRYNSGDLGGSLEDLPWWGGFPLFLY
ncbi:MAG: hypothetical protein PHY16_14075 [Methylobacter sp.]|nr:hypothetical protein [Methylobacter sp.]